MSEECDSYSIDDPDIFSRGSLQLTFDLVRKADPSLALNVRNIVSGEALPRLESALDTKNADHFKVALDSFQVRAIVEALMAQGREAVSAGTNPGIAIMAKALLEDWMKLAQKMISELPESELAKLRPQG